MLILAIPEDLDELLKNRCLAAIASLGKLGGIVEVAVYLAIMLVVTILRPKYCRTHRASEVVNVVFSIQGCYIRPS
jgi:hypothetical protein